MKCLLRNINNTVASTKSQNAYGGVVGCVDCPSVRLEDVKANAEVGGVISMISQSQVSTYRAGLLSYALPREVESFPSRCVSGHSILFVSLQSG